MLPTKSKTTFRNRPTRNNNCLWQPCLLTDQDEISNHYREPSIDAFYHVWIHLAKRYQSWRFFRNWPIRNKNCLWRPCLLMHQDEIRKFYNGPSRDTSYQVSIHLPKPFERRTFFRNKPFRNKNRLWWPCLLTDQNEMCNLYRGPFIHGSYKVSVHLAMWFQRRYLEVNQSETRIACGGHVS